MIHFAWLRFGEVSTLCNGFDERLYRLSFPGRYRRPSQRLQVTWDKALLTCTHCIKIIADREKFQRVNGLG